MSSNTNSSSISNTSTNSTSTNNTNSSSIDSPIIRKKPTIPSGTYSSKTDKEILGLWDTETNMDRRDIIMKELRKRDLFPSVAIQRFRDGTGAYPDTDDPEFLAKLLARREFAESKQTSWKSEVNPCEATEFEITPVQRFCANFMSPKTPYQSALLYHGVGVGKTCAAVQIAENWLEMYPRRKVFIIAPVTIQAGFENTIFNLERVNIGVGSTPNTASQCTGTTYMELTGTLMEKDPDVIRKRVTQARRKRYAISGYRKFANYVRDILKPVTKKKLSEEQRKIAEAEIIRREFSGRLIIIDEAHNLRDVGTVVEEDSDSPGGEAEKDDIGAGKILTPYLDKVLTYAEGLKLVLLTATPMYNSYREIIHLFNLLLKNDKKATIRESDIFDKDGNIIDGGEEILGAVAQHYVSFMRGENPQSFPIRLKPVDTPDILAYPRYNPIGLKIKGGADTTYIDNLPIYTTELSEESQRVYNQLLEDMGDNPGLSVVQLDNLLQPCNLVFPPIDEDDNDEDLKHRVGAGAISYHYTKTKNEHNEIAWKSKEGKNSKWLSIENLGTYSNKYVNILNMLQKAEGVCFLYTRFVTAGALPLALVLEANGYTPYGRKGGLLGDGIQAAGGRQCALCTKKEDRHQGLAQGGEHDFIPAKYILLTGDKEISPYNSKFIEAEKRPANKDGGIIKIVIGSEVASEGVDLKYIREIHIVDPWKHLNKTEQIIGRGIRFCSHTLLPPEKRNTTIYLHAAIFPEDYDMESPELYSYRLSYRKARLGGAVSRIMKQYALDCNLNINAILIQSNDNIKQIDAQGNTRNTTVSDMPFTAICDWLDTCDYKCVPFIDVNKDKSDDRGYDEFSGRWRDAELKKRLRNLFAAQPFYSSDDLFLSNFEDVPRPTVIDLFLHVLNNKNFRVFHKEKEGYITYRNGFYLFQPLNILDTSIPISLRVAKYPVKRDIYTPLIMRLQKTAAAVAPAAAVSVPASKKGIQSVFADSNSNSESSAELSQEELSSAEMSNQEIPSLEKDIKIDISDLLDAWESYSDWIDLILSKSKGSSIDNLTLENVSVADKFLEFLQDKYSDNNTLRKVIESIEMILWLAHSLLPWTDEKKSTFKQICLELLWDEYFTDSDQERILSTTIPEDIKPVIEENILTFEGKTVIRLINAATSTIKYICNGKVCSESVIKYIEEHPEIDPISKIKTINPRTTGPLFGFLAVKDNRYVIFKTNNFPKGGTKMGNGQECAIVSTMKTHFTKLDEIGDILREEGEDDLDLHKDKYNGTRKIKNAHRVCLLIDIILRYLDANSFMGKKWFYRQISSAMTHNIAGRGAKK